MLGTTAGHKNQYIEYISVQNQKMTFPTFYQLNQFGKQQNQNHFIQVFLFIVSVQP